MKHQPYLLIFHGILAVGGLISGIMAWLFLPDMLASELRNYTTSLIDSIALSYTWKDAFLPIFHANVMDMLRVFLCGICLLGVPILIVFLFLKCFAIGFTACVLLQSSILLFITRILFIPVLSIAVIKGCKFSLSLFQNNLQSPMRQLLHYTVLFAGLLVCVLLVSIVDGLANYYYLGHR